MAELFDVDTSTKPCVSDSVKELIFFILYQWTIKRGKIMAKDVSKCELARDLYKMGSGFNDVAYTLCPMMFNGFSILPVSPF